MKNYCLIILWLTFLNGTLMNAQESVSLSIVKKEGAGFTLKEVEKGVFEATTAPNNAVVQFAPLKTQLPDSITVLSFDYFCATGLEFLVVCVNNDRSRIEENLIRMPVAEGWTTFSVDVTDKLKRLQNPGDYLNLLIVPNTARATVMRIKNPLLRAFTEKELAQAAEKTKREEREKRLEQDINIYLKKNHSCRVTEVKVTAGNVEVSGDIKGLTGDVFLCEVPMFGELTENEFLTTRKIDQPTTFTMTFDRYADVDGQRYDRIYSRWVLAQRSQNGYFICSHGRYADHVEAMYDLPHEVVRNKKGIGGFGKNGFEQDIDDLQATSVTVNINLSFIRMNPSDNTIPFEYNGKTYYVDKRTIEQHDRTLQFTASKDVIVSAIVLIPPERAFPDKIAGRLFEHPDFDPAGIYSMPNMTTLESLNLYAAAMDFLASRYSRPDKQYGRIHHWIAHNEVDAGWVWTNAGIKTPLRFMDIYLKSMRLLYFTARKYNPHSETLITLTHYWQERHNEYCYPSAQLLDILLDYTAAEGDFKWGVAHHPYPQSLFEPKSWLDYEATFDYNTPLITFKNLEVLDAWIKQPRTLYQGKEKRTLYLSEQNPNSKDYSEEALQEQAAGMAYALKKMDACTGIDAYQMHGWFDQRGEGGLRIGVRRFRNDETDPGGRKPAWYVFQAFGTEKEDEVFAFAKNIIGIDHWDQVLFKGLLYPCHLQSEEVGALGGSVSEGHGCYLQSEDRDATCAYDGSGRGIPRDLQSDTWEATDALGRDLPTYADCGPRKPNRTVGMFYFVTHNSPGRTNGPYDVTKILAANPENPQWGGGAHYWGEPEAGYYIMKDEWVIRRHARQLADAGVDVIILDHTNDNIYMDVFVFIAEVFRKMRAEGEFTPQIACLASAKSVEKLWDNIYSRGLYADLWFHWKGKPLLLFGQHIISGRQEVDDVRFSPSITNFFTIRQSWAWTTLKWYTNGKDEWPWVDHYPQSVGWNETPERAEFVPVAVAEHPLSNIGRSFYNGIQPPTNRYDVTDDTDKGLYFEQQWQRALEVDPEFVFVTGWNEWTAGQMTRKNQNYEEEMRIWDFFPGANTGKGGREVRMGESYFIDQYNQEYSRDIEPMKDGHTDNYYYQLIANIRKYKGVSRPEPAGEKCTIDVNGSFSQWDAVTKTYYDHAGDTYHRDSPGNYAAGPYINNTGRNDIIESKVARDDRYVYFYVKTADDLTLHTDPYWMLLFINSDGNNTTGWEGYDMLVNHAFINDKTSTVKFFENGKWTKPQKISFRYEGNQLMLRVPRSCFKNSRLAFNFHWADNIGKLDESGAGGTPVSPVTISDFLLNGDHAPSRRATYRFEE